MNPATFIKARLFTLVSMQSPKSNKEVSKIRRGLRNVRSWKNRGGKTQELLWRQIMVIEEGTRVCVQMTGG